MCPLSGLIEIISEGNTITLHSPLSTINSALAPLNNHLINQGVQLTLHAHLSSFSILNRLDHNFHCVDCQHNQQAYQADILEVVGP